MNEKELRIPFNAPLNEQDTENTNLRMPPKQSRYMWE